MLNLPSEPLLRKTAELFSGNAIMRVVGVTGAGVSAMAGIPDFRSPGGLYDSLRPSLLTATPEEQEAMRDDPTQVVNRKMFENNQFPYMEVRRPFIIGTAERRWKPTICHAFFAILHKKGRLHRLFSQNIDTLDNVLLPPEKIVCVHGSMATISGEFCGAAGPSLQEFAELVKKNIKNIYDKNDTEAPKESKNIPCQKCGKNSLKPSTVMYHGAMPKEFFECCEADFPEKITPENINRTPDCMFVCGTSLTVYPCASLPRQFASLKRPIIIANREEVPFANPFAFLQGNLDEQFVRLIDLCGWMEDLIQLAFPKQGEAPALCEQSCLLIKKYQEEKKSLKPIDAGDL